MLVSPLATPIRIIVIFGVYVGVPLFRDTTKYHYVTFSLIPFQTSLWEDALLKSVPLMRQIWDPLIANPQMLQNPSF